MHPAVDHLIESAVQSGYWANDDFTLGYGDALLNPLSGRRFRPPLAWPRIAPRERREAI
jgi:hypothetical protein